MNIEQERNLLGALIELKSGLNKEGTEKFKSCRKRFKSRLRKLKIGLLMGDSINKKDKFNINRFFKEYLKELYKTDEL